MLQLLYAWDVRGSEGSVRDLESQLGDADQLERDEEARSYAARLLGVIQSRLPEIDARIQGVADNWRLARMAAVDRNILRIAAAELLHLPDVPPRAALHEAIRLAEWFGTDESPRFVNGVLDALLRALQPEQVRDGG